MNTVEVKKLMLDRGLTNNDMAKTLGMTHQHFSSILNNKKPVTLENAAKMQRILGVPDDRFVFYFMRSGGGE